MASDWNQANKILQIRFYILFLGAMSSVSVLRLGAHNMMVVEHTQGNGISFNSTKPNQPNSWVCWYHNADHQLSRQLRLGTSVHGVRAHESVTSVADSQSHALKHVEYINISMYLY